MTYHIIRLALLLIMEKNLDKHVEPEIMKQHENDEEENNNAVTKFFFFLVKRVHKVDKIGEVNHSCVDPSSHCK